MNEPLKNNITIKIISVLIAVLFWLYVINLENPVSSTKFTVPLKVENESSLLEKGLVLKNRYQTTVDINVRGRKEQIDKLRSNDFEAKIDFSKVKSVDDTVVKVDGPYHNINNIKAELTSPGEIRIDLEKIQNRQFSVNVETPGTLKPNYSLIKVTPSPNVISLEDKESLINSVASVKAIVDISDIDRDTKISNVPCKVYNKKGVEIPELGKNLSIDVTLEVAKEVPITPVIKGKPHADYVEIGRNFSPLKALIAGPPSVVSKISELKTEPVNIDNIDKNTSISGLIKLPEGVSLVDTPKEVMVNIVVEKLVEKEFNILKDNIALLNGETDGSLNYEIKTESVTVVIKGMQADLNNLSENSFNPVASVEGLKAGTHKVPLDINLPSSVKLVKQQNIEVKITNTQQ